MIEFALNDRYGVRVENDGEDGVSIWKLFPAKGGDGYGGYCKRFKETSPYPGVIVPYELADAVAATLFELVEDPDAVLIDENESGGRLYVGRKEFADKKKEGRMVSGYVVAYEYGGAKTGRWFPSSQIWLSDEALVEQLANAIVEVLDERE